MSGNLFESFFGGRTPEQSWDTKKELEALGDARPAAPGAAGGARAPAAPRAQLLGLVRSTFSPGAIRTLLQRLDPGATPSVDPLADFERFVHLLTDAQVRLVYGKLMHVAAEREAQRETVLGVPRSIQSSKKGRGGRKHRPRPKRRSKREVAADEARVARAAEIARAMSFGSAATQCAKCAKPLMQSEREYATKHAEELLGLAYCRTHAPQLTLPAREPERASDPRPQAAAAAPVARRLSAPDTVVVAAEGAFDFYRRHSAYVCQSGRSFKDVHYVAFYRDKRVESTIPSILEWRDRVPFTRENANRLLDSPHERDQALGTVIWNSLLEGSRVEGARHQVLMLTPPSDARTTQLDRPVKHDGRGPWLRHQRYAWLDALKASRTTTELARRGS